VQQPGRDRALVEPRGSGRNTRLIAGSKGKTDDVTADQVSPGSSPAAMPLTPTKRWPDVQALFTRTGQFAPTLTGRL
jgi:hypothetical protein